MALRNEASFRAQACFVPVALVLLAILQAPPVWWALMVVAIAGVLAAELLNTALEVLADRLHPEIHEMIGTAKNCAAGAVLVFSVSSVLIVFALFFERWPWIVAQLK